MNNLFFNLFCIIVVFQSIVFSFFLFQKGGKISNIFLAVYFIAQAFTISNALISYTLRDFFVQRFSILIDIGVAFSLLWGPAYYLHVKSLFQKNFKFNIYVLLHAIPFIIVWIYHLIVYKLNIGGFREIFDHRFHLFNWIFPVAIVQLFYYNFLSFSLLKLVRENLVLYSIQKSTYGWAKFFVYGYFGGCLLNILAWFMNFFTALPYKDELFVSGFFYFFVFFNFVFYKALIHPEIFYDSGADIKKYHYTGLTDEQEEQYHIKLKGFMVNSKPYLEPNLTLENLAQIIGISVRHLSQVINKREKCNFSDYINRYRIEYVKDKMLDPNEKRKTFLELLFAAGFNSKTSFNIAFKKYTGLSPSQFRKKNINKN
jgi:AraC-like DNA-binding protein